jgi:uncharacterized membrane protein
LYLLLQVGGLASNATVFIVASMLVSPIMGPILGMTFGYRIADWQLFRTVLRYLFHYCIPSYLPYIFIHILCTRE